jgi:dihydrofolate synthase/folylpolyglutamate synthase
MNYQETIEFLFSQLPMYQRVGKAAYKANLDNTLALDAHFSHPHKKFKTIHVAGTNGKGSVSHMLSSIMQEAGLKTGLYTSPHLVDFRERIKINGEVISENEVVRFVDENKIILEKLKPSFFEMTVAMAFNYFAEQNVDVAIIEVGLGGRLDSTNIIKPMVSIITNIGFDHVAFLGDTLAKIAKEKAGIIKQEVPIIIGEYNEETAPVFIEKAAYHSSQICFSERRFNVRTITPSISTCELAVKNEQSGTTFNISLDLLGEYQKKNIIPVFGALQVLTPLLNLPKQAIIKGLANVISNTNLKGRWQLIQDKPKVICDTGHNYEGLKIVLAQLIAQQYHKLHILVGMVDDKDVSKVLSLFPQSATYYFTKASIPRALASDKLAEIAKGEGLVGNSYKNVELAYKDALKNASDEDLIFVGGSNFVVADLFVFLKSN